MEAEGIAEKQDDKDGHNPEESEDDIREDHDVDPDLRKKSHVEEHIDPSHGDADCCHLPVVVSSVPFLGVRRSVWNQVVSRQVDSKDVDDRIKAPNPFWNRSLKEIVAEPKGLSNNKNQHQKAGYLIRNGFGLLFDLGPIDSEQVSIVFLSLDWIFAGENDGLKQSKEDNIDCL